MRFFLPPFSDMDEQYTDLSVLHVHSLCLRTEESQKQCPPNGTTRMNEFRTKVRPDWASKAQTTTSEAALSRF